MQSVTYSNAPYSFNRTRQLTKGMPHCRGSGNGWSCFGGRESCAQVSFNPQWLLFSWWHIFSNRMQLTFLKRKKMKNKNKCTHFRIFTDFFESTQENWEQNSIAAKLLLSPTGSSCACNCNNATILTPYTMSLWQTQSIPLYRRQEQNVHVKFIMNEDQGLRTL